MAEKWIEVYQDAGGEWRWRKKAANGEIVADSGEGYENQSRAWIAAQDESGGKLEVRQVVDDGDS